MLKSKKFKALCCAVALVFAIPVFAFAASDGWTNVPLPSGRGAKELALAPVSNSNSTYAQAHVTSSDVGDMWLRVFDHGTFEPVTAERTCGQGYSVDLSYITKIAAGRWLQLQGGANNPLASGHSSGTCNFG